MNILHSLPEVGQGSFGVGVVALNLAKEQFASKHDVQVWCHSSLDDVRWGAKSSGFKRNYITSFPLWGPKQLWMSPKMEQAASGPLGRVVDIVHQHGIWTGVSRATNILRKKHGTSTIIAPHGSLSSWALNLSRWKKKISLMTYEGKNLHQASCLHATAEAEINDFRDFGLTNPIALIGNGVTEQSLRATGSESRFRKLFQISSEKRILFFLSRITPQKGLTMLIEAISSLAEDWSEWVLLIAGTDEFEHKAEIEYLIKENNLYDRVKFIGPLYGQDKLDAFAAADLFILPSYSEGAPIVILDCLAAGVPIIATKACPWEEIAIYNCGWWVDINADAIKSALRNASELTRRQLKEKGQLGRELVAAHYTWAKLSGKTIALYEWLLGNREKPDFVLLD